MAKFKIKGLDRYTKNLQKKVVRVLQSKSVLSRAIEPILESARQGKSPKTGRNFAKLKQSTIESRRSRAKYNQTSPSFSPSKSNLTFSGQLIDSIKAKIKRTRSGSIILITPTGSRKPYKKKNGKNAKQSVKTNLELAEIQAAADPSRNILEFSKKNIRDVVNEIKKGLRKSFRL